MCIRESTALGVGSTMSMSRVRNRLDDFLRRLVDDLMVIGLKPDADFLSRHCRPPFLAIRFTVYQPALQGHRRTGPPGMTPRSNASVCSTRRSRCASHHEPAAALAFLIPICEPKTGNFSIKASRGYYKGFPRVAGIVSLYLVSLAETRRHLRATHRVARFTVARVTRKSSFLLRPLSGVSAPPTRNPPGCLFNGGACRGNCFSSLRPLRGASAPPTGSPPDCPHNGGARMLYDDWRKRTHDEV
jgi:hypothetical protein